MADRKLSLLVLVLVLVPALPPLLAATCAQLARGAPPEPAAVAMVTPDGEAQKYWPRWRGPSGQGLASELPRCLVRHRERAV
jgi:hypothetical protein